MNGVLCHFLTEWCGAWLQVPSRAFPIDTLWSRTPHEDYVEAAVKQVSTGSLGAMCGVQRVSCAFCLKPLLWCLCMLHCLVISKDHCKLYVPAASWACVCIRGTNGPCCQALACSMFSPAHLS
jgi:hypothetical protein